MSLEDLTPQQREALERARDRYAKMDPATVGIMRRASELAAREDQPSATLSHVLEALLHAPITPSLVHHLQAARSIMEDEHGNERLFVDDSAVLAAMLSDGSLVWQIVDRHVDDMDALVAELRRHVRDNPDSS